MHKIVYYNYYDLTLESKSVALISTCEGELWLNVRNAFHYVEQQLNVTLRNIPRAFQAILSVLRTFRD